MVSDRAHCVAPGSQAPSEELYIRYRYPDFSTVFGRPDPTREFRDIFEVSAIIANLDASHYVTIITA
jgi:hypothetical protein